MIPDVAESIRWAEFYRSRGWNPIASDPRLGYPPFPYGNAKDNGLSAESFERLARRGWTAIQLATGVRWGLVAVDLDGEVARDAWRDWTRFRPLPDTWTVRTPRDGLHLWYTLDRNGPPQPRRFLWRLADPSRPDGWAKHEAIELLGDGWLLRAVPSVRIEDDGEVRRYEWLVGPDDLPSPAALPAWIAALPAVEHRPAVAVPAPREIPLQRLVRRPGGSYRFEDVLAAIPDKLSVAESWGLRVVGRHPGSSGWLTCRAFDREDRHPSARFCPAVGYYWEPEFGRKPLGLFDLAVARGIYGSTLEARDALGSLYGATPESASSSRNHGGKHVG